MTSADLAQVLAGRQQVAWVAEQVLLAGSCEDSRMGGAGLPDTWGAASEAEVLA